MYILIVILVLLFFYVRKRVRVESGVTLAQLNSELAKSGLGIPVLPSISEFSLGGVLATAVHGTGSQFQSLAAFVESFEIITPKYE